MLVAVLLIVSEVSRAVSDVEDADLMPPSGHRSCDLNTLKQSSLLSMLGSIEMHLLSTPWPDAALLQKVGMFTTRLESPSVPVAVDTLWAE